MEELQETLKEDYQRARNSWERKDYVEFLRNHHGSQRSYPLR